MEQMFDEQMFDELLIIYLQNNIDLFTNLRPGRIARDVRQYAQKGVIIHSSSIYSSYHISALPFGVPST
jgi:hypothetical protein